MEQLRQRQPWRSQIARNEPQTNFGDNWDKNAHSIAFRFKDESCKFSGALENFGSNFWVTLSMPLSITFYSITKDSDYYTNVWVETQNVFMYKTFMAECETSGRIQPSWKRSIILSPVRTDFSLSTKPTNPIICFKELFIKRRFGETPRRNFEAVPTRPYALSIWAQQNWIFVECCSWSLLGPWRLQQRYFGTA